MVHLIPKPHVYRETEHVLSEKTLWLCSDRLDQRLEKAFRKLPQSEKGILTDVVIHDNDGEGYIMDLEMNRITIEADGLRGCFYAIQTLRQLFAQPVVHCCHIEDRPDMDYRGYSLDVTRGRIPTLDSMKRLVDDLAYYKMNSLQLYVEHTFAFKEYADSVEQTGCLTESEIRELDQYCDDNFIDLIPSLATFGHLYELLAKERYAHLRELKEFEPGPIRWKDRMMHLTIDPVNPDSFELIKSLLDQYIPLFRSEWFNICCDETFDLHVGKHCDMDVGRLYRDFVLKLIQYVNSRGKKVMMWGDILLKYPHYIMDIPSDTVFLNWDYAPEPDITQIEKISALGRKQIVCPSTWSFNRLVEDAARSQSNIMNMIEYGNANHAVGVLITNWGDWGSICSLELNMFGVVLGAAKAWNCDSMADNTFERDLDVLLYGYDGACSYMKKLSRANNRISWRSFVEFSVGRAVLQNPGAETGIPTREDLETVQSVCISVISQLDKECWKNDWYRKEILLAAEGLVVMSELFSAMLNQPLKRHVNTESWLTHYSDRWTAKNKRSELDNIVAVFRNAQYLTAKNE